MRRLDSWRQEGEVVCQWDNWRREGWVLVAAVPQRPSFREGGRCAHVSVGGGGGVGGDGVGGGGGGRCEGCGGGDGERGRELCRL